VPELAAFGSIRAFLRNRAPVMYDTLREGNLDFMLFQCIPDQEEHVRGEFVFPVIDPLDPELDSEVDTTITEPP